jgi:hypothetical protein
MHSTKGSHTFSRMSFTLASVILLTGLAGCGGLGPRPVTTSNVEAPVWPDDVTFRSCENFASVNVGNFNIQSNYWNVGVCPGEQCIEVNTSTGAFSVTQGIPDCGDHVSSFPNVLYGCSYGNCSPGSVLPMPVKSVYKLNSSWDFAVGGTSNDRWNAAIEIWFCPDDTCGADGFPGGFELMVWLDYSNAKGWKDHLGTADLAGYTWDVWKGDMAAAGALKSWGYMNYIIKGPMITSVTKLNLNAFVKDAIERGYLPDTMYMFAVQAGSEIRSGGIPFNSNSFSLSINAVDPSTTPIPYTGPSCDAGAPTADGRLSVTGNYVTVGPLHGYASAWATPGVDTNVTACAAPLLGPSALCTAGAIEADTTYNSTAGLGFNLNQEPVAGGADPDGGASLDDGGPPLGSITIPNSITVSVVKSGGSLSGNNSLRAQLMSVDGQRYCYGGSLTEPIPITSFNTACWNNTLGEFATPSMAFTRLEIMVPSAAASERDFSYCLTNVTVQ